MPAWMKGERRRSLKAKNDEGSARLLAVAMTGLRAGNFSRSKGSGARIDRRRRRAACGRSWSVTCSVLGAWRWHSAADDSLSHFSFVHLESYCIVYGSIDVTAFCDDIFDIYLIYEKACNI